jgi:hypothetical protein
MGAAQGLDLSHGARVGGAPNTPPPLQRADPAPAPRLPPPQIVLPDLKDPKITLTSTALSFAGTSNGKAYAAELEFAHELDEAAEASKYEVSPRKVQFHILKKDATVWWASLLKDAKKEKGQVTVDWTRYVDEDEADGKFDMGQFGAGAQGFGGEEDDMGGASGRERARGNTTARRALSVRAVHTSHPSFPLSQAWAA